MGRFTIAGLPILLALCWQYSTVTFNYHGNWTALFCAGQTRPLPPQLQDENIYLFKGSRGFDGQFYHIIAHQPLPGDMLPYIEAPQLRYRRILLPGLAYVISFGRHRLVDFCYVAVGFLFFFLGLWWLAEYVKTCGLPVQWALIYAALPASLVFIDRLTLDHVLAALCVGFAYYAVRRPSWQLYVILMLAPLAREIGLLLTAAYLFYCVVRRNWRFAVLYSTTAIPWLLWNWYLTSTIGFGIYPTSLVPLSGLLGHLIHPRDYPPGVPLVGLVQVADFAALLGMLLALGLAVVLVLKRKTDPVAVAALLFAGLTVSVQNYEAWSTVYNYGRIFSPLLVLVALGWLPRNRWLAVAPLILITPRVVIQFGQQVLGVLGGVIGT